MPPSKPRVNSIHEWPCDRIRGITGRKHQKRFLAPKADDVNSAQWLVVTVENEQSELRILQGWYFSITGTCSRPQG